MERLIILSYDFPTNNGGIARLCGEIYNQCHLQGVPVQVITCCDGPEADDIIRLKGGRGMVEWRIWRCLRKQLRKGDVILTGTYHPDGLMAMLTGYPTFMLAHGAEFLPGHTWLRRHLWPYYRRWVLGRATKVVANSHYTARLVNQCAPQARVVALPLAVDNRRFRPTKPKHGDGLLHLCTISRLEKFKAQDFVIQTIALLPLAYKQRIRFTIGGKGPYTPELKRMVSTLGLQEIVSFQGFIPSGELSNFYSSHDVFILTTRDEPETGHVEGFGLVFAEAQACGTPVIGSRTGGIPDVVEHGKGGWLIEQDNTEELQSLLIHLIDNQETIFAQGIFARKRMNTRYTWDSYFQKLKSILNK